MNWNNMKFTIMPAHDLIMTTQISCSCERRNYNAKIHNLPKKPGLHVIFIRFQSKGEHFRSKWYIINTWSLYGMHRNEFDHFHIRLWLSSFVTWTRVHLKKVVRIIPVLIIRYWVCEHVECKPAVGASNVGRWNAWGRQIISQTE